MFSFSCPVDASCLGALFTAATPATVNHTLVATGNKELTLAWTLARVPLSFSPDSATIPAAVTVSFTAEIGVPGAVCANSVG